MRTLLTQMTKMPPGADRAGRRRGSNCVSFVDCVRCLTDIHKPLPSDVAQGGDRDVCVGYVNFVRQIDTSAYPSGSDPVSDGSSRRSCRRPGSSEAASKSRLSTPTLTQVR